MNNFNKVSLGFAEFVSQLLHETFEATLSAQNHQMEKYLEIENSLKLPNERFKELYLSDEFLLEKEKDIFGEEITIKMLIDDKKRTIIKNITDIELPEFNNKYLKNKGVQVLKEAVLDIVVAERKEIMTQILAKNEMAKLMVDSGEIKAKLELSNLSQETKPPRETPPKGREKKEKEDMPTFPIKESPILPMPIEGDIEYQPLQGQLVGQGGFSTIEIKNPSTNEKTIIIDKGTFSGNFTPTYSIPNVRLVAKPATKTSNSNLLSEVTIKFKTV